MGQHAADVFFLKRHCYTCLCDLIERETPSACETTKKTDVKTGTVYGRRRRIFIRGQREYIRF